MNAEFQSCAGMGCSPFRLFSRVGSSSAIPGWLASGDRSVLLTYQARYAIGWIIEQLIIGPGDEVLVPAYSCGAEIDPYLKSGAEIVLYDVGEDGMIDPEDMVRRISKSTRMIHVTHYFGWPQKLQELAAWCREKGVFVLEDCAQALFSDNAGQGIGSAGDAAIYSFVKTLPMPDGGALVFNRAYEGPKRNLQAPHAKQVLLNCLPLFKKWVMHRTQIWHSSKLLKSALNRSWIKKPITTTRTRFPTMPASNLFVEGKRKWSISGLSRGFLNFVKPGEIVEDRRRNYIHLEKALSGMSGLRKLYPDIPDSVCPLAFPLVVQDRDYWDNALSAAGILVGGWPSYHQAFDWEQYRVSRYLKDHVLTLPVYQGLTPAHMEYIAECVETTARGTGSVPETVQV